MLCSRPFALTLLAFFSLSFCLSYDAVGQRRHDVIDQAARIKALNTEVGRFYSAGKLNRALEMARQAVALGEGASGGAERSFGTALNNLAEVYHALGRYAEAEPIFIRALNYQQRVLGQEHADVALTLNNLAGLYTNQGRLEEAETAHLRSLEIQAKLDPRARSARSFTRSLNNLAEVIGRQGRYGEAEPLYRRALQLSAKYRDDTYVGQIQNNLAAALQALGRHIEAEPLLKRALAANVKQKGRTDHSVGVALGNLGSLFRSLGRYAEAETLLKRSISILENSETVNRATVATVRNNLAELYLATGRRAQAKSMHQWSLEIRKKALPPYHYDIGQSLNNLARLFQEQGDHSRAEELFKQAISIFERSRAKNDIEVGKAINNLAELYRAQAHYAEALPLYERSMAIIEEKRGAGDEQVGVLLSNLAGLHASGHRYDQAEVHYKRAVQIFEKALGRNHPHFAKVLANLADLYKMQGRHSEESEVRARLAKLPLPGTRHVSLFFVTNRGPKGRQAFGANRVDSHTFGEVVMRVPNQAVWNRAKRMGESLGQLEMARTGELTSAERLKRVGMRRHGTQNAFVDSMRGSQQRSTLFKNHALVFVHGYNNTFEGVMQRATQVSFDLQFDGILMPFTWPSQGTVIGYFSDQSNAMKSVDAMVSFLDGMRSSMPHVTIHFLAHSMGNQVMLRALCKIAKRKRHVPRKFGQVISAHADVSSADFEKLTNCFRPLVQGITLYVNEKDTALRVRCVGFRCRAGNFARGYSAANVIDTTELGKGFWKTLSKGFDHDVFVRNPLLFADITRLLLTGQRPVEMRTPEFRPKKDRYGHRFWVFDQSFDPAAELAEVAQ